MIALLRAFFFGGCIVMGTSYLTKAFSPLLGSLFWSYPISLIVTLFMLDKTERVETINSLSYISILTPIFISAWSILLQFKISFWNAGVISSLFWVILTMLVYTLTKK